MTVVRNSAHRFLIYGLVAASICMPAAATALAYNGATQTVSTAHSTHAPVSYLLKHKDL